MRLLEKEGNLFLQLVYYRTCSIITISTNLLMRLLLLVLRTSGPRDNDMYKGYEVSYVVYQTNKAI